MSLSYSTFVDVYNDKSILKTARYSTISMLQKSAWRIL